MRETKFKENCAKVLGVFRSENSSKSRVSGPPDRLRKAVNSNAPNTTGPTTANWLARNSAKPDRFSPARAPGSRTQSALSKVCCTVVIPLAFWYFSIGGGVILFTYAVYRQDPVFILGQSVGLFIYSRNLWLIYAEKRRT